MFLILFCVLLACGASSELLAQNPMEAGLAAHGAQKYDEAIVYFRQTAELQRYLSKRHVEPHLRDRREIHRTAGTLDRTVLSIEDYYYLFDDYAPQQWFIMGKN